VPSWQLEGLFPLQAARPPPANPTAPTTLGLDGKGSLAANKKRPDEKAKSEISLVPLSNDSRPLYNDFPRLPKDLAVVILRPRGTESVEQMDRQSEVRS